MYVYTSTHTFIHNMKGDTGEARKEEEEGESGGGGFDGGGDL